MKRAFDVAIATLGAMTAAALVAVVMPAHSQSRELTRGSPCGAPGVGLQLPDRTLLVREVGVPGLHVDPDGTWTTCRMPEPPKIVQCTVPEVVRWSASTEPGPYTADGECSARGGGVLRQGQVHALTNLGIGDHQGTIVLSCAADKLTVRLANCVRAQVCIASAYRATDDGGATWWTYQGQLAEGATGKAQGPDGKTRPVQCISGRLRLM